MESSGEDYNGLYLGKREKRWFDLFMFVSVCLILYKKCNLYCFENFLLSHMAIILLIKDLHCKFEVQSR